METSSLITEWSGGGHSPARSVHQQIVLIINADKKRDALRVISGTPSVTSHNLIAA